MHSKNVKMRNDSTRNDMYIFCPFMHTLFEHADYKRYTTSTTSPTIDGFDIEMRLRLCKLLKWIQITFEWVEKSCSRFSYKNNWSWIRVKKRKWKRNKTRDVRLKWNCKDMNSLIPCLSLSEASFNVWNFDIIQFELNWN